MKSLLSIFKRMFQVRQQYDGRDGNGYQPISSGGKSQPPRAP